MKKLVSIILTILLALALQGCASSTKNASGSGSGTGAGGQKDEKVANYTVKVVYDGKELKSYTIDDIKKMTATSFDLDGSTESGPSFDYILTQNSIKDYSKITITGMLKDTATLTKEQVAKGTLLDITNHDTVKLAAKAIDKNKWVKDIATIEIVK